MVGYSGRSRIARRVVGVENGKVWTAGDRCGRARGRAPRLAASHPREVRDDDAITEPAVLGTDALTVAAGEVADRVGAAAIICISRSGFTLRKVTRFRPSIPILAFSPYERVVRQMGLCWGTSATLSPERSSASDAIQDALRLSKTHHGLETGDQVVVISGISTHSRETDTLQLLHVP